MIKYSDVVNASNIASCCISSKTKELIHSIEIGSCKDGLKDDIVKLNVAYHILKKVSVLEKCGECIVEDNLCYDIDIVTKQINIINKLCKNCKSNG